MAHLWRGVMREYADRLPTLAGAPVITLQEGGDAADSCGEALGSHWGAGLCEI